MYQYFLSHHFMWNSLQPCKVNWIVFNLSSMIFFIHFLMFFMYLIIHINKTTVGLHFIEFASLSIYSIWYLNNANQGHLLKTKYLWYLLKKVKQTLFKGDMAVNVGTIATETFNGGEILNSTLDTESRNKNFSQRARWRKVERN